MVELAGLFCVAFAAATLIPAQSATVLVAPILTAAQPVWLLLVVAAAGDVLGSVLNWVLGRFLIRFSDQRRFPVSPRQWDRVTSCYARWWCPARLSRSGFTLLILRKFLVAEAGFEPAAFRL